MEFRKLFLIMLLAIAGNNAKAEWVKVGSSETDILFADPTSIIKSAYKVKMQALYNYKTAIKVAGVAFLSAVLQEEFDCKQSRSRTLYFSFHPNYFGNGRKAYADPVPQKWEPVRPGSAREALWIFACNKNPENLKRM